jgi:hypothetical protein
MRRHYSHLILPSAFDISPGLVNYDIDVIIFLPRHAKFFVAQPYLLGDVQNLALDLDAVPFDSDEDAIDPSHLMALLMNPSLKQFNIMIRMTVQEVLMACVTSVLDGLLLKTSPATLADSVLEMWVEVLREVGCTLDHENAPRFGLCVERNTNVLGRKLMNQKIQYLTTGRSGRNFGN